MSYFIVLIGLVFLGQQSGVHSVECYACEKGVPSDVLKGGSCTRINFGTAIEKDCDYCSTTVVNKTDEFSIHRKCEKNPAPGSTVQQKCDPKENPCLCNLDRCNNVTVITPRFPVECYECRASSDAPDTTNCFKCFNDSYSSMCTCTVRQKCNGIYVDFAAVQREHTKTKPSTTTEEIDPETETPPETGTDQTDSIKSSTDESVTPPVTDRGWTTKSSLTWNGVLFLASMAFFSMTAGL